MVSNIKNLSLINLSAHCRLFNPRRVVEGIDLDSDASLLMVDFTRVSATTASPDITINTALDIMRVNRIRALLVIGHEDEFCGIVTAMDLMGRKPMMYASEAGIPVTEVSVKHVMLDRSKLRAVSMRDVRHASVGTVMHTLRHFAEQHILVVDGEGDEMQICGMFSASDFRRALDAEFEVPARAQSFADLERVIFTHKEVV